MIIEKVTEIIVNIAHCKAEDVKPEKELSALGLTSLDTITMLFELEEAFDIDIPNELIPSIVTVGDILEKLEGVKQPA
ncbi:MAG: acyl carrier protein [Gammaproteobacteria bacterium]|nr:acyl carrier protein [Gammaproteobacteria bacterium]